MIRRKLFALASGVLVAGGLAVGLPSAHAATVEPTSWGKANLLSYDDSDFENGITGWVPYGTNTNISQDTTHAFLHNASLKLTAIAAGSSAAKAEMHGNQINVNTSGNDTYRISAWVKTGSAVSGRTVTFALGSFDSGNNWLGWTSGTTNTLKSTTAWQYVSEKITEPATAAYVLGSPRITEAGVSAGETLNVDEVLFEPYRAATLIGAETPDGNCDSSNFNSINSSIGPLQTCKIFYGPNTPLPAFSNSICDNLPPNVTCVISFKDDSGLASFVSHIPAGRNVILIYWQEPEHEWFSSCPLPTCTGATYVSQFETEANTIRANVTSANAENVFIASDAEAYQYDVSGSGHSRGTDCSYIPPGGTSGSPDFYFMDQYELPTTNDGYNLGNDTKFDVSTETNNWLSCATPNNKPLGVAELGYNCGATKNNNANTSITTDNMRQDNTYLGGEPHGLPVVLLEYWYDNNVGCEFTLSSAVSEWKSIETQNGGGGN